MTAPLPSEVLAYLAEPRTEAEIRTRFDRSSPSEVLDTLLYLSGKRAIMFEPGSNARKWVQSSKARVKLARMDAEADE